MYRTIYVPVDNSDHSNQAIRSAVALGRAFGSRMLGSHVYAARMHDYRFRQMEYTLPEEYLEETELERQRRIHDSLITMGLQLISDSYLGPMQEQCKAAELEFVPRTMDGKHHVELLRDIVETNPDLVVLGVLGLGRSRDSQIGSVCERVARQAGKDVWVVKHLPAEGEPARDTILVGVDGSPQSFGALVTAIELAAKFGKQVEAIAVYDPYLHYSVFNGVVNVLTEQAAKVFRFEEQNQLHEEIIDCGLAQIYQSHLDVAASVAAEHGVELKRTLLDGKAFQKVLDHVRKTNPWLLVLGRIGVHSAAGESQLGSNTENLLRACPCDVLLTTRLEHPQLDVKAEESIRWTPEAERRMERVPPQARGIARTAVLRLAVEQGHSVVSSSVLDEAMERFMPKAAGKETERLAEALAFEAARRKPTSICKRCGVTAAEAAPVKCAVCGGASFDVVTPELLAQLAQSEGGADTETTYDGRKLQWTQDAKRALWTMKDAYQRRRAKARVEKMARTQRLPTVTLEFARRVVEEESGLKLELPAETGALEVPTEDLEVADGLKLVARDAKRVPLLSAFEWDPAAIERVLRVPAGYMRDQTQRRVEAFAEARAAKRIDLALVEQGIEAGRQAMEELLAAYTAQAAPAPKPVPVEAAPGNGDGNGNGERAAAGKCPWSAGAGVGLSGARAAEGRPDVAMLNEVGLMSALETERAKQRSGPVE